MTTSQNFSEDSSNESQLDTTRHDSTRRSITQNTASRRVVRLSRIDAERLAKGEFSIPEDALHQYDAPPVLPQKKSVGQELEALTPRDKEILAEVPPHFGKL